MDFEKYNDLNELLTTYSKAAGNGDDDIRSACDHLVSVFKAAMLEDDPLAAFVGQLKSDASYASWKPPVEPTIEELIENSSLGTPEAKAIRAQTPPEVVDEVMEKLRETPGSGVEREKYIQVGPHGEVGLYRIMVIDDESDVLARAERIPKHHPHLARSAEVTHDGLRMSSGVLPPDPAVALLKVGGIIQ